MKRSGSPILTTSEHSVLSGICTRVSSIRNSYSRTLNLARIIQFFPLAEQEELKSEITAIDCPCRVLVKLAQILPAEYRPLILEKIFLKVQVIGGHVGAYDVLLRIKRELPSFSTMIVTKMLEVASSIRYEKNRSATLLSIFSDLPSDIPLVFYDNAIEQCLKFRNKRLQASILAELAAHLSGEPWMEVFKIARVATKEIPFHYQVGLYLGLAKSLPAEHLSEFLKGIDNIQNSEYGAKILYEVVKQKQLNGAIDKEALQIILGIISRFPKKHYPQLKYTEIIIEAILRLKSGISLSVLDKLITIVRNIEPDSKRYEAFISLAPYLPSDILRDNLDLGFVKKDEAARNQLLVEILNKMEIFSNPELVIEKYRDHKDNCGQTNAHSLFNSGCSVYLF
jgi:hypothetical protein